MEDPGPGAFPGDATALAAAIPKADAAGVDADVLAAAKKARMIRRDLTAGALYVGHHCIMTAAN